MTKKNDSFATKMGVALVIAFVFFAILLLAKPLHDVLTIPAVETSLEEYPAEIAALIPDDPGKDDWDLSVSIQEDGNDVDGGTYQWKREMKTFTLTVSYEKQASSARTYEPGEAVIVLNRFPLMNTLHTPSGGMFPFDETISADRIGTQEKDYDWSYRTVGDYYVFVNNKTIESDSNVSGSLSVALRFEHNTVLCDVIEGTTYEIAATINGKQSANMCMLECAPGTDRYPFTVTASSPASSPKMDSERYVYVMYALSGTREKVVRPLLDIYVGRTHMEGTLVFDSTMNQLTPDENGGYSLSNSAADDRDQYKFFMIVAYPRDRYENANITESFSLQGKFSPCCLNDFVGIAEWRDKLTTSIASTSNKTVALRDFNLASSNMVVNLQKWNYSINGTERQTLSWFCITSPTHHSPSTWLLRPKAVNLPLDGIVRIGDDRVLCERENGQYELMSDSEVRFTKIEFPKVIPDANGSAYTKKIAAKVYIKSPGETDYLLWQELDDVSNQTIFLRDYNVSSFYIDLIGADNGINFQTNDGHYIKIKIDAKTTDIKNDSVLYNAAYVDVLSASGIALAHGSDIDYAGLPSCVMEADLHEYGKKMHRAVNRAKIGNPQTSIDDGGNIWFIGNGFKQDEKNQKFTSSLHVNASPRHNEQCIFPYEVYNFSFAVVLPEGMYLDGECTPARCNGEYYAITTKDGRVLREEEASAYLFEHATITTKYDQVQRREIVIISYDFKEPIDFTTDDMINGATGCCALNIPVSVSYDAYQEFGSVYTADVAIYYSHESAAGSPDLYDYDRDGDVLENVAYKKRATTSITSALSYQRDVVAHVETAQEGFSANDHQTPLDGNYSYKLRLRTASSAMSDIVIYDHIEQAYNGNKHWQGAMVGIDDSYATAKSWCDAVEKWWSPDESAGELGTDDSWKLIDGTTKMSDIRSVAFKFKQGAGSAVMPQNEMTYVILKMKAPNSSQTGYAYNSFETDWKEISGDTGTVGRQMIMPSNITKVYTEKPLSCNVSVSVENGKAAILQDGEDVDYDIDGMEGLAAGERDVPNGDDVIIRYKPKEGYGFPTIKINGEEIDVTENNGVLEIPLVSDDTRVEIVFWQLVSLPAVGTMNAIPLFAFIATVWVVSGVITLVLFRKYRRKDD